VSAPIFERYGGFAAISKVVMAFYDQMLESDRLWVYFESVDMRRLVDHQTKLIASTMGGPAAFSDQRLREVHAHLGIDRADFDEMTSILRGTLLSHGFAPEDVAEVMREIESKAPLIISEGGKGGRRAGG
jgi:hemoglobin